MSSIPMDAALEIVDAVRDGTLTLPEAYAAVDVLAGHPVQEHAEPTEADAILEAVGLGLLTVAEAEAAGYKLVKT